MARDSAAQMELIRASNPLIDEWCRLVRRYAERRGGTDLKIIQSVYAHVWDSSDILTFEETASGLNLDTATVGDAIRRMNRDVAPELRASPAFTPENVEQLHCKGGNAT